MLDKSFENELNNPEFIAKTLLNSIDGDVQSLGFKISHSDWLDLGSKTYATTSEQAKAGAYQSAIARGWSVDTIAEAMMKAYPYITQDVMNITLDELRTLAKNYPLQLEQNKQ